MIKINANKIAMYLTWSLMGQVISLLISTPGHTAEGDLYDFLWLDQDKKIYVLQNKVYEKKGSFYANAGLVFGLGNEFQDTSGAHLSFGYYFREEWAFEVFAQKYENSNTESYKNLERINGSVPFVRRFDQVIAAGVVWSPFYGKINTFNKIFYFDWSIGASLGSIKAESNAKNAAIKSRADLFESESFTAGIIKTSLRFHATKNIHVDLQYMNTSYKAPGPTVGGIPGEEKFRSNADLILSVGFSF
jgi:outer membrane beta-barrel protein